MPVSSRERKTADPSKERKTHTEEDGSASNWMSVDYHDGGEKGGVWRLLEMVLEERKRDIIDEG